MRIVNVVFILFILIFPCPLQADTLTVKKDGTGDYTSIQTAIGWSASGDVILVYPGVYHENINTYGRDTLTLTSLYSITPHDSLIHQTMINGDQSGSCVEVNSGESFITIDGFTVTNGHGTNGGGMRISNTEAIIRNCIIYGNKARGGAGLFLHFSTVFLSNLSVFDNHAYNGGGGILNVGSDIVFDTVNLCNIYLNYAPIGFDYHQSTIEPFTWIAIDTGTVQDPSHYYYSSIDDRGFQVGNFQYYGNHAKIERMNDDLYVDPSGSDSNSGLTPEDPLRTISFALLKIRSDSTRLNHIYVSDGVYSAETGEKFPYNLKSYVPIVGESQFGTVIELGKSITFCKGNSGEKDLRLKNLSIINGKGEALNIERSILNLNLCHKVFLDSLYIAQCSSNGELSYVITVASPDSCFIRNSIIENNTTYMGVRSYNLPITGPSFVELNGCIISSNLPDTSLGQEHYFPILVKGYTNADSVVMDVNIINCEVSDNKDFGGYDYGVIGIQASHHAELNLINTTIGNNISTSTFSGALFLGSSTIANIYNSIFHGNSINQILLTIGDETEACVLNIYHSLIENGENGIYSLSPYHIINYDSSNIELNPEWTGSGEFPYSLSGGSPCINAGTLDLPEGIELPDTDLAGNPRVSNGLVDMGAYEFLFVGMREMIKSEDHEKIQVTPNPFKNAFTVNFDRSLAGKKVKLELLDSGGGLLELLYHRELRVPEMKFRFDGGLHMKPGLYILKITSGNSETSTIKIIKL